MYFSLTSDVNGELHQYYTSLKFEMRVLASEVE